MKCINCPALRSEGFEYPEEYCAAYVPEDSMVDFKDGSSGCKYPYKRIRKRIDRYDEMRDHQYDGIDVFARESEGLEKAMRTAITSALEKTHLVLCRESVTDGRFYAADAFCQRELPDWLRWAYEEEEEKVQKSFCDMCKWKKRPQKCSCCCRNRKMKDLYEEAVKEADDETDFI